MRAASWDCHRSVLRNDTHAGRTLDPTARSEPIRCGKEYIAFRCRLKAAVPCGKKLWKPHANRGITAAKSFGLVRYSLPCASGSTNPEVEFVPLPQLKFAKPPGSGVGFVG